jgi:hypothetical protein
VSDWLQQSALWCWQNSLAAGAMAAVVLGLRRVWRGRVAPGWLCAAGWLVMLRLFLPAPLSHAWAWDRLWMTENKVAPPVPPVSQPVTAAAILPELPAESPAVRTELAALPTTFRGNLPAWLKKRQSRPSLLPRLCRIQFPRGPRR